LDIYKENYANLKKYISKKYKIKIVYNNLKYNFFNNSFKIISIYNKLSYKNKYYVLIHEFGHYLTFIKNKENLYKNINNEKSKITFVNTVTNEINAWQNGKYFVLKHNFHFNDNHFEKFSTQCIMSYVKNGLKNVYNNKINIDIIDIKI